MDALLVQAPMALLRALADWPLALWTAAAAPAWAVACGLLAGLLAVAPVPGRLRACELPLMLRLPAPPVLRPAPGRFERVAAVVGQGTSVLVRTRGHLLLDNGPQHCPEARAGARVLLPLMHVRGERQIDPDAQPPRPPPHRRRGVDPRRPAGAGRVELARRAAHPLLATLPAGLTHGRCEPGQAWTSDGVRFEFLCPLPADDAQALKSNVMSCDLHVQAASGSAPPTGDIEAAQDADLVQRDVDTLRADVLVVPHHGSRTSSSEAFTAAARPRVAVL